MEKPTKAEQLKQSYARVFGTDAERNEDQKVVWDDMIRRSYIYRTTMVPNDRGEVNKHRMECAEGMRIFMLDTMNLVAYANKSVKKPKVKQPEQNGQPNVI